jgi:hypothetical protein
MSTIDRLDRADRVSFRCPISTGGHSSEQFATASRWPLILARMSIALSAHLVLLESSSSDGGESR